jgi:hypothetical protein
MMSVEISEAATRVAASQCKGNMQLLSKKLFQVVNSHTKYSSFFLLL